MLLTLSPATTALVLIDLQNGIVNAPREPRSGADVVTNAKSVAERFRAVDAPVFLVHVEFAPDYIDALRQPVDEPTPRPEGGLPPGYAEFAPGLPAETDIIIRKRSWGAFYGTELDALLCRRGIRTIVLGGIATNFGVESTARDAWERNYELVVLEDLCASATAEMHQLSVKSVLPRIARVRQSHEIAFA
jgi:nicotinamidase-related amidase